MVVVEVAEAAGDAFGLLDDPVEPFGSGVGDPQSEEHCDVGPPGLDAGRESGGLGHVGAGGGVVEAPQPVADPFGVGLGEQLTQELLDGPCGADLVGGVVGGQDSVESGLLGRRRRP